MRSYNNLNQMREALRSRDDLLVLKRELNLAHKIQKSILPQEFSVHGSCEIHAFMTPAKEVGGDFYDFFKLDSEHIAFLVADVSGKGVPAALFAMANQALIRGISSGLCISTAELLGKVNSKCCKNNDTCMFVTVLLAILNVRTGKLTYTNAGHTPPVVINPDGKCDLLPLTNDVPLGISEDEEFSENTIEIKSQQTIFVYTDGVTEAMNAAGEEFGVERMMEALSTQAGKDLAETDEHVYKKVLEFASGIPAI